MATSLIGRRPEEVPGTSLRVNVVAMTVLLGSIALGIAGTVATASAIPVVAMVLVGLVLMQSPQIAQQWERAVVLRLGRFVGLRGPAAPCLNLPARRKRFAR